MLFGVSLSFGAEMPDDTSYKGPYIANEVFKNLLSGFLGALVGVIISSFVSLKLFKRQIRFQSNRLFVEELLRELQRIYIAQLAQREIGDDSINKINAFQLISYKEFSNMESDLEILKNAILQYRNGREETMKSTDTSMVEVQARKTIETTCKEIIKKIRAVT